MKRPDRENLNAFVIGEKLNVFQKRDAMVEYAKLLNYIEYLELNQSEDIVLDSASNRTFSNEKIQKLEEATNMAYRLSDLLRFPTEDELKQLAKVSKRALDM